MAYRWELALLLTLLIDDVRNAFFDWFGHADAVTLLAFILLIYYASHADFGFKLPDFKLPGLKDIAGG